MTIASCFSLQSVAYSTKMGLIQDIVEIAGQAQAVYNWRIILPTSLFLLTTATYLITLISHIRTKHNSKDGQEPPIIPYWIPVLGSTIPFVRDTKGFIANTL